jgi:hypothetical protein
MKKVHSIKSDIEKEHNVFDDDDFYFTGAEM